MRTEAICAREKSSCGWEGLTLISCDSSLALMMMTDAVTGSSHTFSNEQHKTSRDIWEMRNQGGHVVREHRDRCAPTVNKGMSVHDFIQMTSHLVSHVVYFCFLYQH